MLVTVLLPSGSSAQLDVADTDLVFDGEGYSSPAILVYVELYTLPVQALSLPFDTVQAQGLEVAARIKALVTSRLPDPVSATDPQVVAASNPSDGTCVCFVTCGGTELRYVKVRIDPTP